MCFPCRFLFLWIFFFPFFYFPVSFSLFSVKKTEKKRKFPTLRYERIICVLFALLCERICERNICVRSQHSLDIFHISREGACGSLFLVTFLFLHRNKKVNSPIRSQHSLDIFLIFPGKERSGSLFFGVTPFIST